MYGIGKTGSSNAYDLARMAQLRETPHTTAATFGVRPNSQQLFAAISNWRDQQVSNRRNGVAEKLLQFLRFPPFDACLVLSGEAADELPAQLGDIPGVKILVIDDMQHVTQLPDSIGRIAGLQELSISRMDGLTELPASLGELIHVRQLSVSGLARLTSLPASIGAMAQLNRITLANLPSITTLPEEIGAPERLHDVGLLNLSNLRELGAALTGRAVNLFLHQMPDHIAREALAARGAHTGLPLEVTASRTAAQRALIVDAQRLVCSALAQEAPQSRNVVDQLLNGVAENVVQTSIQAARTDAPGALMSVAVQSMRDYLHINYLEPSALATATSTAQIPAGNISPLAQVKVVSHETQARTSNPAYDSPASRGLRVPAAPPNTPQSAEPVSHSAHLFPSLSPRLLDVPMGIPVRSSSPPPPVPESTAALYERVLARVAAQLPTYEDAADYIFNPQASHPALIEDHSDSGSDGRIEAFKEALNEAITQWATDPVSRRLITQRTGVAQELGRFVDWADRPHQLILRDHPTDQIPPQIAQLTEVTDLTIAQMPNFRGLPPELAQMPQLRHLTLIGLAAITNADWHVIGQLPNLRQLIVQDSGVTSVPDDLPEQLVNLRSIAITSTDTSGAPELPQLDHVPAALLRMGAAVNLSGHCIALAQQQEALSVLQQPRADGVRQTRLIFDDGMNSKERDSLYRAQAMVRDTWERLGGAADSQELETLQLMVAQRVYHAVSASTEEAEREAVLARGVASLLDNVEPRQAVVNVAAVPAEVAVASHSSEMLILEEEEDPSHSVLAPRSMSRHGGNVNLDAMEFGPAGDGATGLAEYVAGTNQLIQGLSLSQPSLYGTANVANVGTAGLPSQASLSSSAAGATARAPTHGPSFADVLRAMLGELPAPPQAFASSYDSDVDEAWIDDLNEHTRHLRGISAAGVSPVAAASTTTTAQAANGEDEKAEPAPGSA